MVDTAATVLAVIGKLNTDKKRPSSTWRKAKVNGVEGWQCTTYVKGYINNESSRVESCDVADLPAWLRHRDFYFIRWKHRRLCGECLRWAQLVWQSMDEYNNEYCTRCVGKHVEGKVGIRSDAKDRNLLYKTWAEAKPKGTKRRVKNVS